MTQTDTDIRTKGPKSRRGSCVVFEDGMKSWSNRRWANRLNLRGRHIVGARLRLHDCNLPSVDQSEVEYPSRSPLV